MEIGILKNTATVEGCRKMLIELKGSSKNSKKGELAVMTTPLCV